MKNVFSKVMWVGRATTFAVGLAVILGLTVGLASTALAGSGVGGVFNLGKPNYVNAISYLAGSTPAPLLRIDNNGTGSALNLEVRPGRPPITVNPTAGKALNLNADKLDGKDSTAFLANNGKAADADKLDGMDSTAFLANNGKAADADKLDGMDSTAFLANNGKAADADKLDGKDSSVFGIKTAHNSVRSDRCATPSTPNECAKVQVVVPPGKTYLVSVWSVMSWHGGATQQDIFYCSAMRNPATTFPSCITPLPGQLNVVTVPQNQLVAASSEGETLELTEGTYVFSTLVIPRAQVFASDAANVITKVMVRDAAAPQPSGVTLIN